MRTVCAGACIKDRKIIEGTVANSMEICLMEDGTMFSPDEGASCKSSYTRSDGYLEQWGYALDTGWRSR